MVAKKPAKKKLVVKKATVKKLSDKDLGKAGGGRPPIISITENTCRGRPCCRGHTDV